MTGKTLVTDGCVWQHCDIPCARGPPGARVQAREESQADGLLPLCPPGTRRGGSGLHAVGRHIGSAERATQPGRGAAHPGGRQTTGTIVSVSTYCVKQCGYQATVRYTDLRGQVHMFAAPHQTEDPAIGSAVTVSYDPRVPGDAHDISIDSSNWETALSAQIFIATLGGLFLFGAVILVVVVMMRRLARTANAENA